MFECGLFNSFRYYKTILFESNSLRSFKYRGDVHIVRLIVMCNNVLSESDFANLNFQGVFIDKLKSCFIDILKSGVVVARRFSQ